MNRAPIIIPEHSSRENKSVRYTRKLSDSCHKQSETFDEGLVSQSLGSHLYLVDGCAIRQAVQLTPFSPTPRPSTDSKVFSYFCIFVYRVYFGNSNASF